MRSSAGLGASLQDWPHLVPPCGLCVGQGLRAAPHMQSCWGSICREVLRGQSRLGPLTDVGSRRGAKANGGAMPLWRAGICVFQTFDNLG
uniref:Uncharacterized protein n=1 Tax=Knipowitschia caucasica TaxID=637954 RepID=A0AAV2KEQ1_KNICA